MFNVVLAHVNTFRIYFNENKLDFVSFYYKNLQRRRKLQQGPEISDVTIAKNYGKTPKKTKVSKIFIHDPLKKIWEEKVNVEGFTSL